MPAPLPPILTLDDATVCPATRLTPVAGGKRDAMSFDGGVYDRHGALVPLGAHDTGGMPNIAGPRLPATAAVAMPGTYLYLGWLRQHFGNYFEESLGRVWAHRHLAEPVRGVVYQVYHETPRQFAITGPTASRMKALPYVRDLLRLAGIDAPIEMVAAPTRFERLIVPGSIKRSLRAAGPDAFAEQCSVFSAMATRVPARQTPPDLYISRAKLPVQVGKIVAEDAIERNLARSDYAILYPEQMPLEDQIAHYVGARRIVLPEGTPIHLITAFASPQTRVAIIARRFPVLRRLTGQLRDTGFADVSIIAERVGAIRRYRSSSDVSLDRDNDQYAHVVLDFDRIGAALADSGMIAPDRWRSPAAAEVSAAIDAALAERRAHAPKDDYRHVVDRWSGDDAEAPRANRRRAASAGAARAGSSGIPRRSRHQ